MDVRRTDRRNTTLDSIPPSTPLRGALAAGRAGLAEAAARARPTASPEAVRALSRPSPETRVAARLDRFYAEMRTTYQLDRRQVVVSPHFQSNMGRTTAEIQAARARIEKLVGKQTFPKLGMAAAHATGTRGTAADVRKTVQAMLDAGGLRPYGSMPPERPAAALSESAKRICRGALEVEGEDRRATLQ